jgi:Uma2 family endonuclease
MKGLAIKKTTEDYRALPEGSPYQLIEGKLIMTPAPKTKHQVISANIYECLRTFVRQHNLGMVLFAPVDVYLDKENAYQPDIFFIDKDRLDILKEEGIYGTPDLIVEILSPATEPL